MVRSASRGSLSKRCARARRSAPHVVEAVLNHVSGAKAGVAGTYNQYQYLEEKRDALNAWGAHVANLVGGG